MIDYRKCITPLMPYVPGRPIDLVKKEYNLDRVIKLASNENPLGCSPKVRQAVIDSLDNANLYPDGNCTALREALAKKFNVESDQIVFGAGTDEVIALLGRVFVNEGDECITAKVTFSQYEASVLTMGGVMVYAPMKNDGFDLEAILERITDKTKIIFLANPNNPTGTMFTAQEQEAFVKRVPESVMVVIDEAYAEFVTDADYPKTLETLKKYKNVVLLKTFSKAYGLASFRVGYGIAHPEIIKLIEKVRNPFNVSVQAQVAALAALEDEDFVAKTVANNSEMLKLVYSTLDEMGVGYIPTFTNFLMIRVGQESMKVFQELMKKGYIIRAGAALGMENYIRVTIGTKEEMLGFFEALKAILK